MSKGECTRPNGFCRYDNWGTEIRSIHSIETACETKGSDDVRSKATKSQKEISTGLINAVPCEFLAEMVDLGHSYNVVC